MNNKTFIACLIALFGLAHTANVMAQVQQPIKLPPQGVVNSIQAANILFALDASGSMGWRNRNGLTPGDDAVRAIHNIVSKFGPIANFGLVRWSNNCGTICTNDFNGPVIPISTNTKESNNRILAASQNYMNFGWGREQGGGIFRWYGGTDVFRHGMGFPRQYFTGAGRSLIGQQCAKTIVILISDGDWASFYWPPGMRPPGQRAEAIDAANTARELLGMGVMTVVIGLVERSHPSYDQRLADYRMVSIAGGGGEPLFAADAAQMEQALTDKLSTILAESFSATSPAVMSSQQFGDLIFQPTFEYRREGQWKGSLKAYSLDTKSMDATLRWDFGEILQRTAPADRRLWTVGLGVPSASATGYRNFNVAYQSQLSPHLGSLTLNAASQIINFVQGFDVFDDNKNGDRRPVSTNRRHMLGDVFHSKPLFVGPPQELDETDADTKGVFGHFENIRRGAHKDFVNAYRGRRSIVLAASNSGVLHAVDASVGLSSSGTEVWGFVPPPILNKLHFMAPTQSGGSSQARYMIDGNITVRDVFINNTWRTYAAFGYGLGARAFTVLDITNVQSPSHVLSIENERTNEFIGGRWQERWKVNVWDQNGVRTDRTSDANFADYKQMGTSTSAPIFTFHRNSSGAYAPVLVMGAGSISRPPAMELETGPGGTPRPSTGNVVFMVGLDGTVGRLLKTVPLHNPASLTSGCSSSYCPTPFNQQVADIEIIEGGGSSNMRGAYGFELFVPNYSGSIQALNLSAAKPEELSTNINPSAVFDPGRSVTNSNDRVITVPISISGLTHERTDGRLNITFGTGDMINLSIQGKTPDNKVYSLQGNESNIVNGREFFSENILVDVSSGATVCPMPAGRKGWQLSVNRLSSRNELNQTLNFVNGKVAAKVTQYGGSTVVPLYKPRVDGQCSIGDSGIYLFDTICGSTRQSQAFNNAMIGGVSIIGDTLVIGISGAKGRKSLSTGVNNFQKIDNLIIGKGVFDTSNTGSGKGTATIYNKQQVR